MTVWFWFRLFVLLSPQLVFSQRFKVWFLRVCVCLCVRSLDRPSVLDLNVKAKCQFFHNLLMIRVGLSDKPWFERIKSIYLYNFINLWTLLTHTKAPTWSVPWRLILCPLVRRKRCYRWWSCVEIHSSLLESFSLDNLNSGGGFPKKKNP